jgi:predicted transposase YbfD/YdcC
MATTSAPARRINSITKFFGTLPDPRVERTRAHQLLDIVTIAILAVIAGAQGWDDIETYGKAREALLREFLDLPGGIPSDDTFRRVFIRLDPKAFGACFTAWMHELVGSTKGKLVAIDGKTLRRSFDRARGRSALHIVHAWVAANRLLLGQYATEEKSNEITAIPELLDTLDLRGAIVTIDAMGCQKKIIQKIVSKEAHYAVSLKGNQGTLHDNVSSYLDAAIADDAARVIETHDEGHGRIEIRRAYVAPCPEGLVDADDWPELRSLVRVERTRTIDAKTSVESFEYITSLTSRHTRRIAEVIRGHWGVENALHWSLDVVFREDDSRIRAGNGPENFALLRRIALVMLRQEKTTRGGAPTKRFKAAVDPGYEIRVLMSCNPAELRVA